MTHTVTPPSPPTEDELEARLRASFDRATARAADDPETSGLASTAVDNAGRRRGRRGVWGVVATAGLVLVVGVAIVVGGGSRREPTAPSDPQPSRMGDQAFSNGSPAPSRDAGTGRHLDDPVPLSLGHVPSDG